LFLSLPFSGEDICKKIPFSVLTVRDPLKAIVKNVVVLYAYGVILITVDFAIFVRNSRR